MQESDKPVIFISCGQYAEHERKLGQDISHLIRQIRPDLEPYLAQNQSDADGLSNNILSALHSAAGFICVMHERGEVFHSDQRVATRGSVWIEQEIAIAAFMRCVLDRQIDVLFYKSPRVSREGILSVLGLNPREFTCEEAILADLRRALPNLRFRRFAELDLEPLLYHREDRISSERHEYQFCVDLVNAGTLPVTDYRVEVHFPKRFLSGHGLDWIINGQKSSDTHACFVAPQGMRLKKGEQFYRETKINACCIPYFVDSELFLSGALSDEVRVVVYSGKMKPKTVTRQMREFQNF